MNKVPLQMLRITAYRMSLRVILFAGAALTVAGLTTIAAIASWALTRAEETLARANRSYAQLAIVTSLEADVGRMLFREISHIIGAAEGDDQPRTKQERAQPSGVREHIDQLIGSIEDEFEGLSGPGERADAQREFANAYAIRALFDNLEHAIDRERRRVSRLDSGAIVREFVSSVVRNDYQQLNRIVREVARDELGEVRSAVSDMSSLRKEIANAFGASILAAALLGLSGSLVTYRYLMRPISALMASSSALASGHTHVSVVPSGPGEIAGLANSFNDMAEKIGHQRAALAKANDELEAAVAERTRELEDKAARLTEIDRTRRLFFAKVGHELKTPLTAVLGEADVALAASDVPASDLREALRHIAANGQFLNRRISNLLALARSEDGKLVIEKAPCDLAKIVRSCIEQAKAFAISREVRLRQCPREATAAPLNGDSDWIAQALLSLIDNAVKFARPGSTVEVATTFKAGDVFLAVRDEGCGVAQEEIGNLFQPYFRSQHARPHAGTGLGLSVAKWVAEQHGGSISARNLKPFGFEILMSFPSP